MDFIDLRSDTVTRPTEAMRRAMYEAEVGDDVFRDDPTVNRLEELAAQTLGKEAALLVTSGTMGNQLAVMAQTRPGDELILSSQAHIVQHEAGGAARLSGVSCAMSAEEALTAAEVERLARAPGDVHNPRSRLVCLENALGSGGVVDLPRMREVRDAARGLGLLVHLDGARLFNAAVALGVEARELAACADTVTFCLSKGLAAPVGSLLCGSAAFVDEARRCRKVLGGGMRQAGVLAACGLAALTEMTGRLAEDHERARFLEKLLAETPGVEVRPNLTINMVFWKMNRPGFNPLGLVAFMLENGVKILPPSDGWFRLVTHWEISRRDAERFISLFQQYLAAA